MSVFVTEGTGVKGFWWSAALVVLQMHFPYIHIMYRFHLKTPYRLEAPRICSMLWYNS